MRRHLFDVVSSVRHFMFASGSILLTAVFVILVSGCGQDASMRMSEPDAGMGAAGGVGGAAADKRAVMEERQAVASDALGAPQMPPAPPQPGQGGNAVPMLIRSGSASLEVDSLEIAIAAVHRIAAQLGGIVGNTILNSGDYQVRSATLELRIPSSRYDDALAGLRPIGKVEQVQSNAQDVGEEYVDIAARVTNARRLEERLISLLANRTGKLEEVLAVERELARVREEIERYEGRKRYLETRVATSTLTVTVHERAPLVGNAPGQNVIANAFRRAWQNLVAFTAGFIAMLGILVPLAVIVAPVVYFGWRWRTQTTRK